MMLIELSLLPTSRNLYTHRTSFLSRASIYLEHAVLIRHPQISSVCLRTRAISGAPHSESWSVVWCNSSYLGSKDHNGNVPSLLSAVMFSHMVSYQQPGLFV